MAGDLPPGFFEVFPVWHHKQAFAGAAAFPYRAGGEVNDFQGVVAEHGDKEALAGGVDGEVVEAAFDARERDGLGELECG